MAIDYRKFVLEQGLLTQREMERLGRDYPGQSPLAAAVAAGLFPPVVGQDFERLLASDRSGGLDPVIPGHILLSEVGRGSRGAVFRAWQKGVRRVVAVKVMPRTDLSDKEAQARFLREVRIAAHLSHPSLVRAYDVGQTAGYVYLVLEYAEGETLRQLLSRERKLPVRRTMEIALKVAEGLAFAAANGIAHRDIKPANIQLVRAGGAKILDLGLARPEGESDVTQPLVVHGTPHYLAPEQARGDDALTPRVDVYALGVVMFRCLTGGHPFAAEGARAMLAKHVNEMPPAVRTLRRDVPDELDRLIGEMLAKSPKDRPDAAQVVARLRRSLDAGAEGPGSAAPGPASPRSLLARLQRAMPAQWRALLPVGAAFASGLLLMGLFWLLLGGTSDGDIEQQRAALERQRMEFDKREKAAEARAARAAEYARALDDIVRAGREETPGQPPSEGGIARDISDAIRDNGDLLGPAPR